MHYLLETEQELRYNYFSGILGRRPAKNELSKSARNMYYSNSWDSGKGYLGPLPTPSNPERDEVLLDIRRKYTPSSKIKEVVDRQLDAILSRSPNWEILNTKELLSKSVQQEKTRQELFARLEETNQNTDNLIELDTSQPLPKRKKKKETASKADIKKHVEAEMLLSWLWTNSTLRQEVYQALLDFMLTGDAKLRTYIFRHYGRLESISDFNTRLLESTKYVGFETLESGQAKILNDDGDKLTITRLKKGGGKQEKNLVEVTFVEDDLTYIANFKEKSSTTFDTDNAEETVEEKIVKIKKTADELSTGLKLFGQVLVQELKGSPFVTPEMIQQNRALNLALTLGVVNLCEHGFESMITTNADLDEVIGIDEESGVEVVVAKELKRGPNTAINLQGNVSIDEKGTRHFEKPGVIFKEPGSIETFDKAERLYYRQILSEARQEFVLMVGDSTTTGESRIQARQDFLKKSQQYKNLLDKFCSNILTGVLHLLANICGDPDYFQDLTVYFDTRISAGELSAAEQQVIVARYEKGLISRETALVLLGSEEPLIEIDKIRLDIAEAQEEQIRRLAAASRYSMMVQAQNSDPNTPNNTRKPKSSPTGGIEQE